jgi:hypothetical protein
VCCGGPKNFDRAGAEVPLGLALRPPFWQEHSALPRLMSVAGIDFSFAAGDVYRIPLADRGTLPPALIQHSTVFDGPAPHTAIPWNARAFAAVSRPRVEPPEAKMLTADEAAAHLGMDAARFELARIHGGLPAAAGKRFRLNPSTLNAEAYQPLWNASDLDQWQAAQGRLRNA